MNRCGFVICGNGVLIEAEGIKKNRPCAWRRDGAVNTFAESSKIFDIFTHKDHLVTVV